MSSKENPSTKARKQSYIHLRKLKELLMLLLLKNAPEYAWKDYADFNFARYKFFMSDCSVFSCEFGDVGWKDFMIRHLPELKRGGSSETKPSKRRRSKKADRNSTVRSGLRR